jgi:hypothetical protein
MIVNPSSTVPVNRETLDIQELAIALYAENLPPALSRLDFLRFSGIIPQDWQTVNTPVEQDNLSQIQFTNGANVLAQPRTVNFFEAIASQPNPHTNVAAIARRYVECLPNVEYQALSINPKIVMAGANEAIVTMRQQFLGNLLSSRLSQAFEQPPMQIGLNLVYPLSHCQLNLNISEVRVAQSDQSQLPAILFSGSFNYQINGKSGRDRLEQLRRWLDNWPTDLETFRKLVRQQFLGRPTSLFPPETL